MPTASLLLLLGCHGDPPQGDETCAGVTFRETAWPVLVTWCTPCHATTVPTELRQGAPPAVNFDTYAGAAAWADEIAARATGEAPSMPPAGGVPADQRAALATWVTCGAPGTSDPAPATCAAPRVVEGDVRASASPCTGDAIAIAGDLAVDVEADLSCVCSVGGALTATAGTVALPALTAAGSVALGDVSSVDLRALRDVTGDLSLVGPTAAELDLGGLVTVGGALTLTDLPTVTEIVLDRAETVGGGVTIARDPQLVSLRGTVGFASIGGDLLLEDLPLLADGGSYGYLVALGGSITVRRTGIARLEAFDRLLAVPGDVVLEDDDQLVEASPLPDLESVGGALRVTGNDALVAWYGLPWLADVGGDLAFTDGGSLADLPGLDSLAHVGGDLRIEDNPALPTTQADALAGRVAVDGAVVIQGNAP